MGILGVAGKMPARARGGDEGKFSLVARGILEDESNMKFSSTVLPRKGCQ